MSKARALREERQGLSKPVMRPKPRRARAAGDAPPARRGRRSAGASHA
jgi:hypothetical protein